ncbi:prephenate dehydrogenase/arogenate dehydrogenase family protein [Sulfobacillus sp. hq2]|uniref:prephenate dehydrogenase n=1 Tax=Sulfobacillus TaxID=28033 RepID=UPI000CD294DF|nr:prephenate dehydrogenase/arogenate dehydrogenase family protein [Sulfobacillus sp. hq2]POB09214.1 hypothetical protein CO251_16795 [Sulfobacillus sp. hq2]
MKLGVIGLGLIGGSIAQAFSNAGWDVWAWDVDQTLKEACEQAAMHFGPWQDWLDEVDQIVIAAPLATVGEWIVRLVNEASQSLVIVDVSSVKMPLVPYYRHVFSPSCLVSLHPMAGKEVRGFAHRDGNLFRGRPCLVVPWNNAEPRAELIDSWMQILGTTPVTVPLEWHDPLMSMVSHVPYLISASVLALTEKVPDLWPHWPYVAGTGFMDVTRIGASDVDLWQDILNANRQNVQDTFARYTALINEWNDHIQQGLWPQALRDAASVRQLVERVRTLSSSERTDIPHGTDTLP